MRDGDVIASSTDTQDGTQDPIESISLSDILTTPGSVWSSSRPPGQTATCACRPSAGPLAIQLLPGPCTDTRRQENADQCGDGRRAHRRRVRQRLQWDRVRPDEQFGRSSHGSSSEPDGTAITAGNFSSTGGKLYCRSRISPQRPACRRRHPASLPSAAPQRRRRTRRRLGP